MTAERARSRLWFWPCLLLLVAGALVRWLTLGTSPLRLPDRLQVYGYSDIVAFYSVLDLARHPLPYLQQNIEYPVLTGFTIWLTSFAPGGLQGYFWANAALMIGALLATFALLRRTGPTVILPYFALAPGLAFYGMLNWDALGVLGLTAAIYATRRGRFTAAGVALALGGSAKLFPLFVLPVLWAHTVALARPADPGNNAALKRFFPRAARRLLGRFTVAALVVNLPVFVATPAGWSYFLRFQAGRSSNLDSIWSHLPPIADWMQTLVFALVCIIGGSWLVVRVLRGARWEVAAFLTLLLFLLSTKVYSPQYDLWLLPFLALLAPPVRIWLAFVIADAFYFWAIFSYFGLYFAGVDRATMDETFTVVGLGVWWREAALALLFIWALLQLRGPTEEPSHTG